MASCSSSLALPELTFLSPQTTTKHRFCLSKVSVLRSFVYRSYPRYSLGHRSRIRAIKEDGVVVEEKREAEVIKDLNGIEFNGNGTASTSGSSSNVNGAYNGSMEGYTNGNLVKYVNGNGNGAAAVDVVGEVMEEETEEVKEDKRKKKVEEIGKEDAWFKRSSQEKQIEV